MSVRSFALWLLVGFTILAGFIGLVLHMNSSLERSRREAEDRAATIAAVAAAARPVEEPPVSHRAALDSMSPGSEWYWIADAYPPPSPTNEVRGVAYFHPATGAFIQAIVLDWEERDPAAFAKYDLGTWKETYPDGTFTDVVPAGGRGEAGFAFSHHSGHAEGIPGGCRTQLAFMRLPGVKGLVRVTSEGRNSNRRMNEAAFKTVVETLEAKPLLR